MLLDIKDGVLTKYYAEEGDSPNVQLPAGITEIGKEAFAGCMSVRRVVLSEGVTRIAERAFSGCYFLSDIRMPESLETIGERAFDSCGSLRRIDFPSCMKHIERGAFYGCSALKTVRLPDGLTELETELFGMCRSLHCVSLPASLKKAVGCSRHSKSSFFGVPLTELHLRGGWFDGFSHALNISVYMILRELYVPSLSRVPRPLLSAALSTFARHEDQFSPDVRQHYYAHLRTNGKELYDVCATNEEVLHLLCRENLILPQDAWGYFALLVSHPDRLAFLTEHLCRRQLLEENTLQSCLNTAIEQNLPEITAMLLDYKQAHTVQGSDDDLTL